MSNSLRSEKIRHWLAEPLPSDVQHSLERLAEQEDVAHIAVMPDVHLAEDVCVGTVVATRRTIIPAAVGGDIGCGMAALGFDATAELLGNEVRAGRLLESLYRMVPAMRHPHATMPKSLTDELERLSLSDPRLEKLKRRDGLVQFGTLGRGNHFLEFQSDSNEQLWMMVHSGSRAMGQAITALHLGHAEMDSNYRRLDADSTAGRAYLNDVAWARKYAESSRLEMVNAVVETMAELFDVKADWSSLIHSDHNHVHLEGHFGEEVWVHRKGALSAQAGEAGIIPGSMGDCSFHVEGKELGASLSSSSHGAGRALSRTEARRRVGVKELERQMHGVWFDHRRAEKLRDEAPSAYKDIRKVMRAQRDLTRIVRELRPLLSYKGS